MALSNNYVPTKETGNGVTTVFTGTWDALSASFFRLYLENKTTGVQTLQTQGVDYSFSFTSSGWTATFLITPPPSTVWVIGARVTTQQQATVYKTSRGFQGSVHEGSYDRLTAMVQELQDAVDRSLTFALGSTSSAVVPEPGNDGEVIGWNGGELANLVPNTDAYLDPDDFLLLAGGTMTGKLNTVASATGAAGLNIPHGTAPSSPVNGDVWTTTAGVFARINGVTQQIGQLVEAGTYAITLTPGTSGTITLEAANDTGAYTKTLLSNGKYRYDVQGLIIVNSVSSPVGALRIPLPATASNLTDTAGAGAFYCAGENFVSGSGVQIAVGPGEAQAFFTIYDLSGQAFANTAASRVQAGVQIYFRGSLISDA